MEKLLALLLTAGVSSGAVLLSEDELREVYATASSRIEFIQEMNKSQTKEAAVILYQLDNQTQETPDDQTLVNQNYLKEEYLK